MFHPKGTAATQIQTTATLQESKFPTEREHGDAPTSNLSSYYKMGIQIFMSSFYI